MKVGFFWSSLSRLQGNWTLPAKDPQQKVLWFFDSKLDNKNRNQNKPLNKPRLNPP